MTPELQCRQDMSPASFGNTRLQLARQHRLHLFAAPAIVRTTRRGTPGRSRSRAPAMFKHLITVICLLVAQCAPGIASAAESDVPSVTRVLADIAYGPDPRQRFDVYIPPEARNAPVLILVHGGGWRRGWKDHPVLIPNKADYWLPKGYILVSTGYRLIPDADPMAQARDIARALAVAQKEAPAWGGNPDRFVLMGHSAGAHLVALLSADPAVGQPFRVRRPLG